MQPSIESLLPQLLSHDNQQRGQAEQIIAQMKETNPAFVVSSLVGCLSAGSQQPPHVKHMAAILLRKYLCKEQLYAKLLPEQRAAIRQELLQCLVNCDKEQPTVRRGLTHAVAALASQILGNGEWPELIPFLFNALTDQNPNIPLKTSSLQIFNQMSVHLPDDLIQQNLDRFTEALKFALDPKQAPEVRFEAVAATASILMSVKQEDVQRVLPLLHATLATLTAALNEQKWEAASTLIEHLIGITDALPEFFQNSLGDVLELLLNVAGSPQVVDNVRQMAIEFFLTYIEADPRTARKAQMRTLIDRLFKVAMEFSASPPDEANWGSTDEDEEEVSNYDVGVEALDRISLALKGKTIEPIASFHIKEALQKSDWKSKNAGLMALAQIAEGCQKQLHENLPAVVSMVTKHLDDENPRVRWAAVHCIAQFSSDFAPDIQLKLHQMVLPRLMASLGDPVPKVQAHAGSALICFLDVDHSILYGYIESYLDEMVTKLLIVLQSSRHRFVSVQMLSALSGVVELCEAKFVKYYDAVVPFLKSAIRSTTVEKQDRMIRAKAMECITLVGMNVGKEKFSADAQEVMELLYNAQQGATDSDDPQSSHLLQAWCRLANTLGQDFVPYLKLVIPPLLQQASMKTDVEVYDADEERGHEEDEDVQVITLAIKGVGEKKITIRTSLLEDKALAVSMLHSYLTDLKEHMHEFIEDITKVVLPLLTFAYQEDIREASAKILPLLISSGTTHIRKTNGDMSIIKYMLNEFVTALLQAIQQEPVPSVACVLCESFAQCLNNSEPNSLTDEQVVKCSNLMKAVFQESMVRRKKVNEQKAHVQDDEDEVEKLDAENEGEEELLTEVVEAVGALVKTHKTFIAIYTQLFFPMYTELLMPAYTPVEHRLALCAFDDFVEHGMKTDPNGVLPKAEEIIRYLLQFSAHSQPDVVQASSYGMGVCAQYLPQQFTNVLPQAIERLQAIIKTEINDENECAIANAISSLYKIFEFHQNHPSVNKNLLLTICSKLPVKGDEIEARYVHDKITDLVVRGYFGQEHMQLICHKFSEALRDGLLEDHTKQKMVAILKQNNFPVPEFH